MFGKKSKETETVLRKYYQLARFQAGEELHTPESIFAILLQDGVFVTEALVAEDGETRPAEIIGCHNPFGMDFFIHERFDSKTKRHSLDAPWNERKVAFRAILFAVDTYLNDLIKKTMGEPLSAKEQGVLFKDLLAVARNYVRHVYHSPTRHQIRTLKFENHLA